MIMGVCSLVHFALAFMMMFLWVEKGLYELIDVMFLMCAVARMDYCCLICYDVNILINLLQYVNLIGLAIQNGKWDDIYSGNQKRNNNFASTVLIMDIVYYTIAIILSFYAYRHWKSQLQDYAIPADGSAPLMGAGMGG